MLLKRRSLLQLSRLKKNRQIVGNALVTMKLMGYVVEHGNDIVIQQVGIEAYKKQNIHQIAVSLTEAKRVRVLTKWTIRLSVMAIIVSLVVTLCR